MNKENAHLYLPLVQAMADGKKIQYQQGCKDNQYWVDFEEDEEIGFYDDPEDYRIKPEPRTFEIVRSKFTGHIYNAETYDGSAPSTWERITVQEVLE
jgi:hypothetical protein